MEQQRTLKIGDRIVYCYEDGSVEYLSKASRHVNQPLIRTTGSADDLGYKYIRLSINGKRKNLKIHRLIALAFHPNPEDLPEVDHINRDTNDNRPCNLRWVDHKTNMNNRDCVDQSVSKYGVRRCENQRAYLKAHGKHCLNMIKPDGSRAMTRALTPEVYNMLKPLSQRERFFKYEEIKDA